MLKKISNQKILIIVLCLIGIGIGIKLEKDMLDDNMLHVNEVCTKNLSIVSINDDKYTDGYIELYNAGDKPIHLDEYFISNRAEKDSSIALPDRMILPGDYLMLYIEHNGMSDDKNIVLDMEMKGERQGVYLMNARGKILSSLEFPELQVNMSFGRKEDGGEDCVAQNCTPNLSNDGAIEVELPILKDTPVFSADSGFYEDEFYLTLTADKEYEIYYTLDGSTPTKRSCLYQEPIHIIDASANPNVLSARTDLSSMEYDVPEKNVDKAMIVRAVLYDDQSNKSKTVTKTYFVGKHMIEDYGDEVSVASVVTEPENLIGREDGILILGEQYDEYLANVIGPVEEKKDYQVGANFGAKGRTWEREALFEFFDNKELKTSQTIGMRTRGKSSSDGPQKGFGLFARKLYDENSVFTYDFFFSGHSEEHLILKRGITNLLDGFVMERVADRSMRLPNHCPVALFMNGEYWGLYTLMEKYDERFFENYYGVDREKVVVIHNKESSRGLEADHEEYLALVDYVLNNDLSIQENYDYVCSIIDIESLIDYYCIQIYIDNIDCAEWYNRAVWKTLEVDEGNPYADGRWRWSLHDIDASLVDYTRNNLSEDIRDGRPAFLSHYVIEALLHNEQFRIKFINTFMDIMNFNFEPNETADAYIEKAELLERQMELQGERITYKKIDDFASYKESKKEFWEKRREYVIKYMQDYFWLGIPQDIYVEMNEGIESVRVNTSRVTNEGKEIHMQYFPGVPISLEVQVKDGYVFRGWQTEGGALCAEKTMEIIPGGEMHIEVLCEKVD